MDESSLLFSAETSPDNSPIVQTRTRIRYECSLMFYAENSPIVQKTNRIYRWMNVLSCFLLQKRIKIGGWMFFNRIFSILYQIHWIRWISWIQLEPVKHDSRIVKAFLCLSLTAYSFSIMVSMPDWWSVVWVFKAHRSLFFKMTIFLSSN